MSSSSKSGSSGGVGIFGVVGIIFVVLKLVGVIEWSWWWVLSPFWIPILAVIALVFVLGILSGLKDYL